MTHEDKQKLAEQIAEKAMSVKNVTYAVVLQAVYEALNARDEEMKQLRNPWISIKEQIPPIKTRVLFLDNNGKAWFGKNTISGYAELECDKPEILPPTVTICMPIITHWMPIPKIQTQQ